MHCTIVVDDFNGRRDLLAEHGLSIHLKTPRGNVLFDAGQGICLLHNAHAMGLDLGLVDHLVLSHGHYDHSWGIPKVLQEAGRLPFWAHPAFEVPHHTKRGGRLRYCGAHLAKASFDFKPVEESAEIIEGVWAISVPNEERNPDFAPKDPNLIMPEGKDWVPDPFDDDLSMVVKGRFGYSVILGCAHAGAVNILEAASRRFDTKNFYAVVGGMHMEGQSKEFLERSVAALADRFSVTIFRPCHCTGFRAAATLASAFDVDWAASGTSLEL